MGRCFDKPAKPLHMMIYLQVQLDLILLLGDVITSILTGIFIGGYLILIPLHGTRNRLLLV